MLTYICLYIIAYSHIKSTFRPDLRIDFSSDLYVSIIFMFTHCLKFFVLVYCNCFYYACIHIIVSLLLHVYNYIHARFRAFKAHLHVAFRQCLYKFIIFVSIVLFLCFVSVLTNADPVPMLLLLPLSSSSHDCDHSFFPALTLLLFPCPGAPLTLLLPP